MLKEFCKLFRQKHRLGIPRALGRDLFQLRVLTSPCCSFKHSRTGTLFPCVHEWAPLTGSKLLEGRSPFTHILFWSIITKSFCVLLQCSPQGQVQINSYILIISCSWPLAKFMPISKSLLFPVKPSWIWTGFLPWVRAENSNLLHMKCFYNVTQYWVPGRSINNRMHYDLAYHSYKLCSPVTFDGHKGSVCLQKNATIVWQYREWH